MTTPELLRGKRPMLPSPFAGLAVVESVAYGLVARHAYAEALPVAVPITLTFIFLVPMAAGYRFVASSDERRVGLLTPWTAILMMLAAAVALGGAGLVVVLLLMPVFMLMALIGGALASLVRAVRCAAMRVPALIVRTAASPHRAGGSALVRLSPLPNTRTDRVPRVEPRDTWQQIIIRTPL